MIHEVQVMDISGSGTDVENQSKDVKYVNRRMTEILARHCKQPHSKIVRDCKIDRFMNAEAALEYGIIDEVLLPSKKIPDLIKPEKKVKAKRVSILPPPPQKTDEKENE
jgi:ATP-dependent Clp protease protease subunit